MDGKLRNMAGVYIIDRDKMLLLYRIGSRVVEPSWCNIGGHMEKEELNDTKAGMLRELNEEIGLTESDLSDIINKVLFYQNLMNMLIIRRKSAEMKFS